MKYFQILAIFGVLVRLTKTEDEGSNGSGKTPKKKIHTVEERASPKKENRHSKSYHRFIVGKYNR